MDDDNDHDDDYDDGDDKKYLLEHSQMVRHTRTMCCTFDQRVALSNCVLSNGTELL